jgi:hypothetical protein
MKKKRRDNLLEILAIISLVFFLATSLPSCTAILLASMVAESCEEEIEQVGEAVLQVANEADK